MEKQKGFTLIELIIYVGIFIIAMQYVAQFCLTIIETSAKNSRNEEISSQSRFISSKIQHEIRNAKGINIDTSNFNTNLALNRSYQLSLIGTSPNDPIIISVDDGAVKIKKGDGANVALNSSSIDITNLTFSNYSSVDNKTKNIGFDIEISTNTEGKRAEYTGSITVRTAAEIRSN